MIERIPRTELLKACKLLKLLPSELTNASVEDGWKKISDEHTEHTVLLTTAKDLLISWLKEYPEAHYMRRSFGEYVFVKAKVKLTADATDGDWFLPLQSKLQQSWDDLAIADTRARLKSDKVRRPVFVLSAKPNGEMEKVRLVSSTGNSILDNSGLDAIKNVGPYPTPFGEPVLIQVTFEIEVPRAPEEV